MKPKHLFSILVVSAVFLTLPLSPPSAESSGIIWLEAESFDMTGGWVNDSQFVDIMGSPYLLANGVDEPVEDAVTTVRIPESRPYRLWVRCKDWLPPHSPGKFQVWIGGKASETAFGQSESGEWRWEDGGMFDLQAGKTEIRLHDLTGWWGRCDAVVLSPHNGFTPAGDVLALERQRIQYFDPYREAQTLPPY
ncbi:MAG: FAD-dependent oxidoreductase, partial [Candidatus Hinthialibacter sp.]